MKLKKILILLFICITVLSFLIINQVLANPVLKGPYHNVEAEKQTHTTCNSCKGCTSKLDGRFTQVRLTEDIEIPSTFNTCINVLSDNIIFNCGGHTIDGLNQSDITGINMQSRNNITIKNCQIKNVWGTVNNAAIYLKNTNHSKIIRNYISNTIDGIYLINSKKNEIKKNIVFDSKAIAISAQYGSNENLISKNEIKKAGHIGIAACTEVTKNIILGNTVIEGLDEGICLCSNSNKSLVMNNFACYNQNFDIGHDSSSKGFGYNNTCDPSNAPQYQWNDFGVSGCTHSCPL